MHQLTQKLKTGEMKVLEVPFPPLQQGHVIVRNYYSLISAGTESDTIKAARKGYIGKAKERPQQVKQVFDALKTQGITQTYRAVMKKLDAYSPLGYSCAGEVIDVAPGITGFHVGDLVACGGITASHSEVICVPVNLCVKLKPDTEIKQAAYNTLGAVALQGVRQADLRLGEYCMVIGLGLLGQLTALLLKASGIQVIGMDIDPAMVEIAGKHCLDLAIRREENGIEDKIIQFTNGMGCDAVIITAASNSLDPINFSGAVCRKKGTVVVVGAVPTGFDREPHYYKKELQLRMSCSYGPGRYDPAYEDKGIDYPLAYVRWTENRNMQAFQELIYAKKIDVSYLTTHTFKLDDAPAAYDMMISKSEPFIGLLIEYDASKELNRTKITLKPRDTMRNPQTVSIGFIGAGSYAQSHLLPHIPKNNVTLKGVMTASGSSSRTVADRYGFEFCTADEKDILESNHINTIFIATRHNSHAGFVLKALKAGKHVFVEKPLCLKIEELNQIVSLVNNDKNNISNKKSMQPILMVGYNRRFSPLTGIVKEKFGNGPMSMIYRINAGSIPADSWIQDMDIGGGRIIGEVCHFVDYLTFINGSIPVSVYASAMKDRKNLNDVLSISLSYMNGSIGTILYFANGDQSLPKERVEIYANGSTAVLDNFKTLSMHNRGKKKKKKLLSQDKGQKMQVLRFIQAVMNGSDVPIPLEEICNASVVTFKIIESIRSGNCVIL